MKIKFIKDCVWSYSDRLISYKKGEHYDVDDCQSDEIIKLGYAEEHKENKTTKTKKSSVERKMDKQPKKENKSISAEENK